jgi:hypothetical protein
MTQTDFPGGKRFAFTILDDSEATSVEAVSPVYALLEELGMRTTLAVWPLAPEPGARPPAPSQTLQDPAFRDYALGLRERGFEITWHGAASDSCERGRTEAGLEHFRSVFGAYPRVHDNHAQNRENLYWGPDRVDQPLLKAVVHRALPTPIGYYGGHVRDSPFWWGDLCAERIDYVRNLGFDEINLTRINPSMPYRDPVRPCARWWFSCSEAEDRAAFAELLRPDRQERLEREGGWCIVSTRLAQGFARGGAVDRLVRKRLESIARRDGWFVPVGTLLDHLRTRRTGDTLPSDEWDRMQWRWARDLVRRKQRTSRRREAVLA